MTPNKEQSSEKEKDEKKMNVLFIAAWYPHKESPTEGVFVREHAKSVSLFDNVCVLHSTADKEIGRHKLFKTTNHIDGRVKEVLEGFRSFGMYSESTDQQVESIKESAKKKRRISKKLLTIPFEPFKNLGSQIYYSISIFIGFKSILKSGWRPDIIHAHLFYAGIPAIAIGRLYRIPVVTTEHYIYLPPRIISGWDVIRARIAVGGGKMTFPPTRAYKESLEYYGIKSPSKIIPNVVDTDVFFPSGKVEPHDKTRILFVGILNSKKNVPSLLRALGKIRERRSDFHLDIVGDGPSRKECENLVEEMKLVGMVTFHGRKDKMGVATIMRNCDFFTMPSYYEGFGVVYIEAMACGKPVIASNSRGPDEIVNRDVGLLVDPNSLEDIEKSIEHLLNHYQEYDPQKISDYARDNFSYNVVGMQLHQSYIEVIENYKNGTSIP
jgi:glycosyltransferase involved in cell wall biosynthesis